MELDKVEEKTLQLWMVLHSELVLIRTDVATFGKRTNCEEKIHPEVSKRAPGRKGRRLNAEERLENEV